MLHSRHTSAGLHSPACVIRVNSHDKYLTCQNRVRTLYWHRVSCSCLWANHMLTIWTFPRYSRCTAHSIIELLVTVGILSLLIAVVLPELGRARTRGTEGRCLNQLREVGLQIQSFAHANDDQVAPVIRQRDFSWSNAVGVGWDIDVGRWSGLLGGPRTIWACPKESNPYVGNARALGLDNTRTIVGGLRHRAGPNVWSEPSRLLIAYDAASRQVIFPNGPGDPVEIAQVQLRQIGDVSDELNEVWPTDTMRPVVEFQPQGDGPHSGKSSSLLFADGHARLSSPSRGNVQAFLWIGNRWWPDTVEVRPYLNGY